MSSDLGNKEVMAENIKYYMAIHNVNSVDMCRVLHVAQSTFSYWINAKYYPRIDKIEQMANFFNISKADLVEKRKIPAAVESSEISDKMKKLPPDLYLKFRHFVDLAEENPDSAERFLSFAVQELESLKQSQ